MRQVVHRIFNNNKTLLASIFVFHICMICVVFHEHILHPLSTMLFDRWDGLKNNFTLVTYVKENIAGGDIFKYQSFNYPFGDYVYSTDNTPLFAIIFKWFCHHVYDLSAYTLVIFNYCILANIVACGLLVFYVFRKLFNNNKIAWLSALFLPWINFQALRLLAGHFNLSLSSLILLAIALFIGWYNNKDHFKKQFLYGVLMCLLCFFGFLIHGYYLIALPAFLSGMLFCSGIMKIRSRHGVRSVIASILVPAIAVGMSLGFINATDGYFKLRQDFANGYDWMEQKTIISLLFTPYDFNKIVFPLRSQKQPDDIERMMYLGNIGLYAVAILFLISFFNRRFRLRLLRIQKDYFTNPLLAGIFVAGLLMLSMSLGERYYHLMTSAKVISPVQNIGNWTIWEILFSIIMMSVSMYTFFKAVLFSEVKPDVLIKEEDKKIRLLKIAGFYILSAVVLYLLFGGYTIGNGLIKNGTNPLWYLHKFTRKVEQFRSLSRFGWPFYWSFYIWILYTVSRVYQGSNKYGKVFTLILLSFLGAQETIDYAKVYERSLNQPTVFAKTEIRKIKETGIDFKKYQSIIPIPYYQVGCEDYNYTIDEYDSWSAFTYNLSIASRLPLMSSKLARTPPAFAKELLFFVAYDKIGPAMARKLNTKPILVAVNRKLIRDSTLRCIPNKDNYPQTNEFYWKATQLTERNNLQPVDSLGAIYFYSWEPLAK